MSSNLPPGVTESMLPGNRPEDEAFDSWADEVYRMIDRDIRNTISNSNRLSCIVQDMLSDNFDHYDPITPSIMAERIEEFVDEYDEEE